MTLGCPDCGSLISGHHNDECCFLARIVIPFTQPKSAVAPIKSPGALDTVREYFDRVHATRGHGATDCGEMMWSLPDGDYFLLWLAERGFIVAPIP